MDLVITADGEVVCMHDRYEPFLGLDAKISKIKTAAFLANRFADRLTTLRFRDLLELLRARPDASLVLDVKGDFLKSYEEIVREVSAVDDSLFSRLIVQIYHPPQLDIIEEMRARGADWGLVLFTLYRTRLSDEEVVSFVSSRGVPIVTMPKERLTRARSDALHAAGVKVLVHTLNHAPRIRRMFELGADGIYTDFARPGEDVPLPDDVFPPF